MQNKRIVAVLLLSIALTATAIGLADASSVDTNKANNGGYTVTPATGLAGIISPLRVSSSITQGQTNWHSKDVIGFYTSLNVDLNWGNPSNSLRLKIYTPDGYTLGPYYDSEDGTIDGRINIYVNNPNGIAEGTWYYEVYGYSVTGTQSYTI